MEGQIYPSSNVTISFYVDTYPSFIECYNYRCWLDGRLLDSFSFSSKSINLTGLSDGKHNLRVALTARTLYSSSWGTVVEWNTTEVYADKNFVVDAVAPTFTFFMSQNRAFKTSDVSINFTVDKSVKEMFYSMDGNRNVTLADLSKTLLYVTEGYSAKFSDLHEGFHNLTIYAKDEAGNIGKSETYYFTVNSQPTHSPSPSPSPTATAEPILEPAFASSPPADNVRDGNLAETGVVLSLAVIAVAVGLLIYIKRRKG
jgi:hypothetical protein